MKVGQPFLVLALLLFAGCSDSPADDASPGSAQAGANGLKEPPTWSRGEAWEYRADSTSFTIVANPIVGGWGMLVDDVEMALDAGARPAFLLLDVASDFAVLDASGALPLLNFPLEDGKTWMVSWGNHTLEMHASVAGGKATLHGSIAGETWLEAIYDPDAKWFSKVHWRQGPFATGAVELREHKSGFSGTAYRTNVEVASWDVKSLDYASTQFLAPEGPKRESLNVNADCQGSSAGRRVFSMSDAEGTPVYDLEQICPGFLQEELEVSLAPGTADARWNSVTTSGGAVVTLRTTTVEPVQF